MAFTEVSAFPAVRRQGKIRDFSDVDLPLICSIIELHWLVPFTLYVFLTLSQGILLISPSLPNTFCWMTLLALW